VLLQSGGSPPFAGLVPPSAEDDLYTDAESFNGLYSPLDFGEEAAAAAAIAALP